MAKNELNYGAVQLRWPKVSNLAFSISPLDFPFNLFFLVDPPLNRLCPLDQSCLDILHLLTEGVWKDWIRGMKLK